MTGEGQSYQERQRGWVQCPWFGGYFARGSLANHFQTQHSVARWGAGQTDNEWGGVDNPRKFRVKFLVKAGPRPFPVDGCSGCATTRTAMQVHLWHQHVRNTVVIIEEVDLPHPRFPLCDMLVPWRALNGVHWHTS